MNELTLFYKTLLKTTGYVVDGEGLIREIVPGESAEKGNNLIVQMVNGRKVVVFPCDKILRGKDWDDKIIFHPLTESAFHAQSPILRLFNHMLANVLINTINDINKALLSLMSDPKKLDGLSLQQLKLIEPIRDMSKGADKYLNKVCKRSTGLTGVYKIISLALKKGNDKYSVTGKLNTLLDQEPLIWKLKGSTKVIDSVVKLFEVTLCKRNEECGSNSLHAPRLSALIKTFVVHAKHLNSIKNTLGKHSGDTKIIDLSWTNDIDETIEKLQKALPQVYEGNKGDLLKGKKEELPWDDTNTDATSTTQQQVAPIAQTATTQTATTQGIAPIAQNVQQVAPIAQTATTQGIAPIAQNVQQQVVVQPTQQVPMTQAQMIINNRVAIQQQQGQIPVYMS